MRVGGAMTSRLEFDKIGYWSVLKLEILKKYAAAYTRIMWAQKTLRTTTPISMLSPARELIFSKKGRTRSRNPTKPTRHRPTILAFPFHRSGWVKGQLPAKRSATDRMWISR